MRKARVVIIVAVLLVALAGSGRFLIVDQPVKSDVIVVLAGETDRRPARGLELLGQGYGSRMMLDVPAGATIYKWNQLELAQTYVDGLPQAQLIAICPIRGLSTREEAQDVSRCLPRDGGHRILLVTSEYHTRRALSVFRAEMADRDFSIAAVYDSREFGTQWWRQREWAKVNLYEWMRLLWWELVDRWR